MINSLKFTRDKRKKVQVLDLQFANRYLSSYVYYIKQGPLKNFKIKSKIGQGTIVGFLVSIDQNKL